MEEAWKYSRVTPGVKISREALALSNTAQSRLFHLTGYTLYNSRTGNRQIRTMVSSQDENR